MNQLDVLLEVAQKLKKLGINYMLTGSYAVSFYGKPRTTHDIDLKVEINSQDIEKIYEAFKDSYYVSKEMIEDAIKRQFMFNLISDETQTKVDFWLVKDTQFDKERFARRLLVKVHDISVYMSTAEDIIIIKLLWYQDSGIQKHFDDVFGIVEIQQSKLDLNYLHKWCQKLSLGDLYQKLFPQ